MRQLATERKFVTILRADLHCSTDLVVELELEEALGRLAPALEQMRQAVHAQAGVIHRELGDGLFAIFGAPVANDQHAVMACLAAFDLQARIASLRDDALKVRIGLHTGELVVGPRALDLGSTYDFDGPALILAERLQAAAEPGQVLVSSSCHALSERHIRFGATLSLTLKGFPHPVPAHVALGIGELSKWQVISRSARTDFVGRQAELAELLSLTATAAREQRGIRIGISGEAGVGKSRLAHECLDALKGQGCRLIAAECSAVLGGTPFSTLSTLLDATARALGAESLKALKALLPAAQAAALTVLLSPGVGGGSGTNGDPAAWTALPPLARRRTVLAAAQALVGEAAKEPTVLLLEDLQWADEASVPATQAIVSIASQQKLIIIATARSEELPQWFASRAEFALQLNELDRAGALELLERLLGASPRLASLKRRILEHTGGMPLFLEEVCRWLVQTGALHGDWGAFELTRTGTLGGDPSFGVPLTVQGVIASRIDQLGASTKRVLQIAAAIGPTVPAWLLQALAGEKLGEALDDLARASMLLPQTGSDARRFAHDLVRQVAYDAVLVADKRKLHGRILEALERREGPAEDGALAHHALRAQAWDKAAEYSTAIARSCFAKSALPESCRHYELALRSLDRLDADQAREERAIDLRLEARLAYANAGQTATWLELAKQAATRSEKIGDSVRHVAALAVQAAALNFCGTPMDAIAAGREAVEQARRHDKPGWLAYAEYGLGQALYIAGRYREAVTYLDNARRRFAMEGATPPMGGSAGQASLLCCMMACLCNTALGDDAAALDMQRLADEIAKREQRPLAAIGALYCKGAMLLRQRRPADAETALASALELANRLEINLFIPVLGCLQALALLMLGRRDEVKAALDVADTAATWVGHRSASLRIALYRAVERSIVAEQRAQGLQDVQALTRTVRQEGFDPLLLEALLLEASLNGLAGDVASAASCAAAAEEVAAQTGALGTLSDMRECLSRYFN